MNAVRADASSIEGLHILIAEDNLVNQKVLTRSLERLGCSADVVANGTEAVERVQTEDYDLVLMDCHMPLMDGYQATREIRALDRLAHLPIIAVTANVLQSDRDLCVSAGMDDFLTKPIDLNALRDTLAAWGLKSQRRKKS